MTQNYRITAATGIHKGDRDYQQDQVALIAHPRATGCVLGVVADGMGGRTGGRKASDQVILTTQQLFKRFSPAQDEAVDLLKQMAKEANTVIKLTAISSEQEPHSTIAVFLINPDASCYWAHSGDSRIYHFRGDKLVKRTSDHSLVQTMVDKGELTEEEAKNHPKSNIVTGCLGMKGEPPIGLHRIDELKVGDTIMACSDGIWHYFKPEELGWALSTLSPREASEFLIEKARSRGNGTGDNMSMAIVKFEQ